MMLQKIRINDLRQILVGKVARPKGLKLNKLQMV